MSPSAILVFGGNGQLAGALRHHLPSDTRYAARTAADRRCIAVDDYTAVLPPIFKNTGTVINCSGIVAGDPEALHHANVAGPLHLAKLAREAGVRRFVHVSSFSVLGGAPVIGARTPPAPVSDYGRSKLAAETGLLALATADFAVVPVRLPAIVGGMGAGGGGRDKLAQLIALWLRLRRLPVPCSPIERSMISVGLAAQVLAAVAHGAQESVCHAADPQPFTYRRAAKAISGASGRTVGVLPVPDALIAPLAHIAPGLFDSLYTPSVLAAADNQAAELPSDLYPTIAQLARQEVFA